MKKTNSIDFLFIDEAEVTTINGNESAVLGHLYVWDDTVGSETHYYVPIQSVGGYVLQEICFC